MIEIKDEKDCCGCWACENICPVHCITMPEDKEGFRYPQVDKDKCINCHLCEKVCPIKNKKSEPPKKQKAFVVQNKDSKVLRESTSGGAFTALAEYVIGQGGVVFGAAFDSKQEVRHQYVDKVEDLKIYRNSKYVQSLVGDTYSQVKNLLRLGRIVLFSGTPCQLEGLVFFLREKTYDNLILVDVVCRAVPSPLVLRKYLDAQRKNMNTTFSNIKFRDKYHGYKYSSLSLWGANKKEYHEGIDTDKYLRAFFSSMSIRESCSACKFRSRYRRTDLTLWDCFDIGKYSKEMDNDKGATRVLVHTEKGMKLMEAVREDLKMKAIDVNEAVSDMKQFTTSEKMNQRRQEFFEDLNRMDPEDCFNKYFPITPRHIIEKQVRLISNRLGIYKYIKKAAKAVIGNREIKR